MYVGTTRLHAGVGIAICLVASALALAVAPLFMPEGYSWIAHTTSESAAQGLAAAWVAQLGFVLFGLGVIWLATGRRSIWGQWAASFHAGFGAFMVATAVFSARSWDPTMACSPIEDALHSAAATLMGFSFAFGVLTLVLQRWKSNSEIRRLDVVALGATAAIPISMMVLNAFAGALQRVMFVVAYAWYLREVYLLSTSPKTGSPARGP